MSKMTVSHRGNPIWFLATNFEIEVKVLKFWNSLLYDGGFNAMNGHVRSISCMVIGV